MEQKPIIVIFTVPGMGHLIPMVEFATRLCLCHRFSVTFLVPDGSTPPSQPLISLLQSLPPGISYVTLPPVDLTDLYGADVRIETRISVMVVRSLPSIRRILQPLAEANRLAAFVADMFCADAFTVARDLNVSPYLFFPSTAMCLSLLLYLPELDRTVSCEFRDLPEPVQIPGCSPVHGQDLLTPVQDRTNDAYKWFLHHAEMYSLGDGIILNSFMDMEFGALGFLLKEEPGKPMVYPIGPMVRTKSEVLSDSEEQCLLWLDGQPRGSVLYVSFGSTGTHTSEQLNELALGLEMSRQRFLWVVRPPNDRPPGPPATNMGDPFDYLPQGLSNRTKGRGLLVRAWAPQARVLGHISTGGFLTHCGWNSTLESVVNGVPLIAWPLYAEQRMNAVMLTEDLKVALRPKANENGLVGRDEIGRVARALMEGDEGKRLGSKMGELKVAANKALNHDGSSTKTVAHLADKWMNNVATTCEK